MVNQELIDSMYEQPTEVLVGALQLFAEKYDDLDRRSAEFRMRTWVAESETAYLRGRLASLEPPKPKLDPILKPLDLHAVIRKAVDDAKGAEKPKVVYVKQPCLLDKVKDQVNRWIHVISAIKNSILATGRSVRMAKGTQTS